MRLTVHLSTFNRVNPCAYAILWLDREQHRWSRESHFGIDLPRWGTLNEHGHATEICAHLGEAPILVLEGLEFDDAGGPFEGETGSARWTCAPAESNVEGGAPGARGHWHVQCVDEATNAPENSVFADDDAA